MNYLLDTCLLSELRKSKPDPGVVTWISTCDEHRLFVSILTLGEIQKGVAKLAIGDRKNAFQHWLDSDLIKRFAGRILQLDLEAALEWGLLSAAGELTGKTAPVVDCLLAVTAITKNLVLVTRNEKDFRHLPVKILNPWVGS